MAFGLKRKELEEWKRNIDNGEIAFLTHYWLDPRFPGCKTVTKAGCKDLEQLANWGGKYSLKKEWIHIRSDGYSHFDLIGNIQIKIMEAEGLNSHIWK